MNIKVSFLSLLYGSGNLFIDLTGMKEHINWMSMEKIKVFYKTKSVISRIFY